jgi:hypothetical protein
MQKYGGTIPSLSCKLNTIILLPGNISVKLMNVDFAKSNPSLK